MPLHDILPTLAHFPTQDELLARLSWASPETRAEFWREISRRGTPIWDPGGTRATFCWRNPEGVIAPDSGPAHLQINRVSDQDRELGFMQAIPGTDIWVRTLDLSPTLLASYSFAPPGQQPGPPRHNHYPNLIDPHSSRPPLIRTGDGHGLSLLGGSLSPRQPEWRQQTTLPGSLNHTEIPLPLGKATAPARPCHLYLPPPTGQPVALLTLFDAEIWFTHLNLPAALANAVAAGRIPPVAVLGIGNLDQADRIHALGANPDFLAAVAGTATTWAEQQAEAAGIRLRGRSGRVIAGQSLGGLSALLAAHLHAADYGTAICQSPSLWWTPDGASTPRDFGSRSLDWICEESLHRPARSTRVHLDVGLREGLTLPRTHQLNQLLQAKGWDSRVNTYDGGHDFAWWRGALLDQLAASLGD